MSGCMPIANNNDRCKAKGRASFENSPLLSDLSKIWFGFQITTTRHFRFVRSLRAELALTVRFRHHIRCKSFPGSIRRSQFPECARESRCRFSEELPFPGSLASPASRLSRWPLSTLSYWKIAPPLIRKILANEFYATADLLVFLWKYRGFCGNSAVRAACYAVSGVRREWGRFAMNFGQAQTFAGIA